MADNYHTQSWRLELTVHLASCGPIATHVAVCSLPHAQFNVHPRFATAIQHEGDVSLTGSGGLPDESIARKLGVTAR